MLNSIYNFAERYCVNCVRSVHEDKGFNLLAFKLFNRVEFLLRPHRRYLSIFDPYLILIFAYVLYFYFAQLIPVTNWHTFWCDFIGIFTLTSSTAYALISDIRYIRRDKQNLREIKKRYDNH